jgi:Dynamin central region
VLRIANNEVERLVHGSFVVKNRSTQEIKDGVTVEDRHVREKEFFDTVAPWTELKKDRVGLHALQKFLGGLLYNHIRSEFPGVLKDIEQHSLKTQKELELLGPSRRTTGDQRRFLTRLATAYQRELGNALGGNYNPACETDSPLKLRMHLRNLNDEFALDMARKGHTIIFRDVNGALDPDFVWDKNTFAEENIYEWIRRLYRMSRGPELPGMLNPVILENMFRQQSSNWEVIATGYLEKNNFCCSCV